MEEHLRQFGVFVAASDATTIRSILQEQTQLESRSQGRGDTELMRLCCFQLFCLGDKDDILPIWRAKTASMDADASIDIVFLCSGGLDATLDFLRHHSSVDAKKALARLESVKGHGTFDGFSVSDCVKIHASFYDDSNADSEESVG